MNLVLFAGSPTSGQIKDSWGVNSSLALGEWRSSFEARKLRFRQVCYEEELLLRGGASIRFHPKRRASIDHRPGPNIARPAAVLANNIQTHRSPEIVNILKTSIRATEIPAIGVHRPVISNMPAAMQSTASMATLIGGSLARREIARTTSAEPTTTRMRSNPIPGQPPANVEYRRRNDRPPNIKGYGLTKLIETPKGAETFTL